MGVYVRERPPLALSLCVTPPGGGPSFRWGNDSLDVTNSPDDLTFTTSLPGGFAQLNCTLNRNRRVPYADEQEFSNVTVLGLGGRSVAWQGRFEQFPDIAGYQAQVNPQASGWQAHLQDDDSAAMIFVDQDLTTWEGPTLNRQIQLLGSSATLGSNSTGTDPTNYDPAIILEVDGSWASPYEPIAEAWYDAEAAGLIAKLYYSLDYGSQVGTGSSWFEQALLASTDTATADEGTGNLVGATLSGYLAPATPYPYALLQHSFQSTPGGVSGYAYQTYWRVAVYGDHGLTGYGSDPVGFLASDMVGYTLSQWCPKITYTTGTNGSIQPSSFIIPQAVFNAPTTASTIIQQLVSYELLDWAVWESGQGPTAQPCFYLNAYGARGNQWQARVGPAQLQDNGPNVSRIWNGVIVQFTAVDGTTQTVGPPGSNATAGTSSQLLDTDSSNPANEAGLKRWALVTMGTSTPAGAIQTGSVFLQAQKELDSSGQAAIQGHCLDNSGVYHPAWAIRAGDYITFVDSTYSSSARRIVSTSYDHASRTNTLQLDQPPDAMDALLQRLSIVLAPSGFS